MQVSFVRVCSQRMCSRKKIILNVISPNDPGVTFVDIGVLDEVKETLKKLVMLPLHRPELFNEGQLRKVLA